MGLGGCSGKDSWYVRNDHDHSSQQKLLVSIKILYELNTKLLSRWEVYSSDVIGLDMDYPDIYPDNPKCPKISKIKLRLGIVRQHGLGFSLKFWSSRTTTV